MQLNSLLGRVALAVAMWLLQIWWSKRKLNAASEQD